MKCLVLRRSLNVHKARRRTHYILQSAPVSNILKKTAKKSPVLEWMSEWTSSRPIHFPPHKSTTHAVWENTFNPLYHSLGWNLTFPSTYFLWLFIHHNIKYLWCWKKVMNAGLWKLKTSIISWCAACVYPTHKCINMNNYLWIYFSMDT